MLKILLVALLLVAAPFAGEIVNVGETTGGSSSTSPPTPESDCYNQHTQCLRDGCIAAGGDFNEANKGCYNGDDGVFAQKVGECSDLQGECLMGASSGDGTAEEEPLAESPVCKVAFVLAALAAFACAAGR